MMHKLVHELLLANTLCPLETTKFPADEPQGKKLADALGKHFVSDLLGVVKHLQSADDFSIDSKLDSRCLRHHIPYGFSHIIAFVNKPFGPFEESVPSPC